MAPRKYEVSDQVAWRWVERRRRGESFSRIAQDEEVDRRIVAKIVRRFERREALREAVGARRDVAADFLREHFEEMTLVATTVLGLLAPPSVTEEFAPAPYEDIEASILARLEVVMYLEIKQHSLATYDTERPISRNLKQRAAALRSRAMLEGLKEHLPNLWPAVERTNSTLGLYRSLWNGAEEELLGSGFPPETARLAMEKTIEAVRGQSQTRPGEEVARGPAGPGVPLDRDVQQAIEVVGKGKFFDLSQLLDGMDKEFRELERILSPPLLQKALVASRCRYCPVP